MQRMKVVLPEPDGPMMQTVSPFVTSSETPFSTSSRPKRLWTSCGVHDDLGHRPVDAPASQAAIGFQASVEPLAEAQLVALLAPARRRSIHAWMNVQTVVSTRYQNGDREEVVAR